MQLKTFALFLLAFLSLSMAAFAQAGGEKEYIEFPLTVKTEWLTLPANEPTGGGHAATTYSALKIQRVIDPKTNEPYDQNANPFASDPLNLRRSFRLDKNSFVLGEPILVEFRVELDGPGEWEEPVGGSYRATGRDDNFLFLLKRTEDGSWAADPYVRTDGRIAMGGGLGSAAKVTKGNDSVLYNPLQRWAAIEKPGSYELYCFQFGRYSELTGRQQAMVDGLPDRYKDVLRVSKGGMLVDKSTGLSGEKYLPSFRITMLGETKSPLIQHIPADVQARVGPRLDEVCDFAKLNITIIEGSPSERTKMVEEWVGAAEASEQQLTPAERIERARQGYGIFTARRKAAAREAIWFVRQNDFLPYIGGKIAGGADVDAAMLAGLSLHPSPAAFDLLFRAKPRQVVGSLTWMPAGNICRAVPLLIEWLTLEDSVARVGAANALRQWTGQSPGQDWEGTRYDRPTLIEGRKMQPLWRNWWKENEVSFCEKMLGKEGE